MNLTELIEKHRDALTTIATNHSFAVRMEVLANLPAELQRVILNEAGTIDKAAQKLLNPEG